jgi:hypothetical protein
MSPTAATLRVQTAMNGFDSAELCSADCYAFAGTDCASSVGTYFAETKLDVKYFESVPVCPLFDSQNEKLGTSVTSLRHQVNPMECPDYPG